MAERKKGEGSSPSDKEKKESPDLGIENEKTPEEIIEDEKEKVNEKMKGETDEFTESVDGSSLPDKDKSELNKEAEGLLDEGQEKIEEVVTESRVIETDLELGILSPELIDIMDKIRKYKKYQEEFEKNKQIIEGESVEQLQERFDVGKKAEELFMELQRYKLTTLEKAKEKIENKEWAKKRNEYSQIIAQIDAEQEWLKENFINQNKSDQIVVKKEQEKEITKDTKKETPAKENIESGTSFSAAVAMYYPEFEDIKESYKQKQIEKGYNKAQNDFIPGPDFKVESKEVYMKRLEKAKSESEPDYYRIGINIKFLQAFDSGEIEYKEKRKRNKKEKKPVDKEKLKLEIISLLDRADKEIVEQSIVAIDSLETLKTAVVIAKKNNVDLSDMPNLDDKIEELEKLAPLAEIKGSLAIANILIGQVDKKEDLTSWYWKVKGKLNKYEKSIPAEEKETIEAELENIAKELFAEDREKAEQEINKFKEELDKEVAAGKIDDEQKDGFISEANKYLEEIDNSANDDPYSEFLTKINYLRDEFEISNGEIPEAESEEKIKLDKIYVDLFRYEDESGLFIDKKRNWIIDEENVPESEEDLFRNFYKYINKNGEGINAAGSNGVIVEYTPQSLQNRLEEKLYGITLSTIEDKIEANNPYKELFGRFSDTLNYREIKSSLKNKDYKSVLEEMDKYYEVVKEFSDRTGEDGEVTEEIKNIIERLKAEIEFLENKNNADSPEAESAQPEQPPESESAGEPAVEKTTDQEKEQGLNQVKQAIEDYAKTLTLEDFKNPKNIKAGIEKIVSGLDPKLLGHTKFSELKNIVNSYYSGIMTKVEEVLQVAVAGLEAEQEKEQGKVKGFFKKAWKEAKQNVIKPGIGGMIYAGAAITGRAAATLLEVGSGGATIAVTAGIGAFAGAGAAAVDYVFGTNLLNKMGDWGKGMKIGGLIKKLEKSQKPAEIQKALQEEVKEDLGAMTEYDISRQGDLVEMEVAIKMTEKTDEKGKEGTEEKETVFSGKDEEEKKGKRESMNRLIKLTEQAKFEKSDRKLDKLTKERQKLLKENIESGAVSDLLNAMVQKKVKEILEGQGKSLAELPQEEQNEILTGVNLLAEQQMNSLFGDVAVQEKFDEISESAKGYFGRSYVGKILNKIPIEGFVNKVLKGGAIGAAASLAFGISPAGAAAYFGVKRFMGSLRGEIILNQPDKVKPQIVKGIAETKEVLAEINANLAKDPENKELQQKQAEVQGTLAELDKKLEEVNKAVDKMGDLVETAGEVMRNLDAVLEVSDEQFDEQTAREAIVDARARLKLPAMKAPDRAKIEQKIKLIQDRVIQLKLTSESSEYNDKIAEDIVNKMQAEQTEEVDKAASIAKQEKKRMKWLGKKGLIVQYARMWKQDSKKAVATLGISLGRASVAAASGAVGAGGLNLGVQTGIEYANTGEVNTANLMDGINKVLDGAKDRAIKTVTVGGAAVVEGLSDLPDDKNSEQPKGNIDLSVDSDEEFNQELQARLQKEFSDLNLQVDEKTGEITRAGKPGTYLLQQDGDLRYISENGNEQILKAGGGDDDWQPSLDGRTVDEYLEKNYQDIAKSDQPSREQIDELVKDPHAEQLLKDLAADGKIVQLNTGEYFSLHGLGLTAENLADGVDNAELQKVLESAKAGNAEAAKLISVLEANRQIEKFEYPGEEEGTVVDKYFATGTHYEDTIDSDEIRGNDSLWRSTRDTLTNNAIAFGFEGDPNDAAEVKQWAEGKTAELVKDLAERQGGEIADLVHQGDRITIDITPEGAQLNVAATSGQETGHLDDTNVVGSEAARHLAQFYGVSPEAVESPTGDVGMKFELNGEGNEGKSVIVMDWDRDGNPNVQLPDGSMQEMTMDQFKEYLADNMEIAEERIIIPAESIAEISENLDIIGIDTATISEADFAEAQENLSEIYDSLYTDDHELSTDVLNVLSNAEKIVLSQDIDRVHQLVTADKEPFKGSVYGDKPDDMRHEEVRGRAQEYASADMGDELGERNWWTLGILSGTDAADLQKFTRENAAAHGLDQNNKMNILFEEYLQHKVNPNNPEPLEKEAFEGLFVRDGEFSQERFNEQIQEFKDQIKVNKLPETGSGWKPMLTESGVPMMVKNIPNGEAGEEKYVYKMPGGPEQERTILGMNAMLHSVSQEQQTEWQEKVGDMRENRTQDRTDRQATFTAEQAEAERVAAEAVAVQTEDKTAIPGENADDLAGATTGDPKVEADKGKGIEDPITAPAVEPIETKDVEKPAGMKEMLDADFSDGTWSPDLALGQEINETIPSEWREPGNPYADLGKELGIDLSQDLSSEDIAKLQQAVEEVPTQSAARAAEMLEVLKNKARDYHADKLGIDLSDGLSQAEFDKLYKGYFEKDASAMELANFLRHDPEMSKTLDEFIKGKETTEVPGADPDDLAAAKSGKEQLGKVMTINGQEVNVKAGVYADADLNKYQKAVEQVEGYIDAQNKVLQEYLNTSKELTPQEKVYFKEYLSTVGETYDKLLTKMGSDLEAGKQINFNITPPSEQQGIELAQQIIKSMNEFGIPSVDFYTNYNPDNQTAQIIPTAEISGALDKFGLTLKDGELEIKGSNDKYTFIKENSTNGNIATKLNFYSQGADTILVRTIDNDGKVDSLKIEIQNGQPKVVEKDGVRI